MPDSDPSVWFYRGLALFEDAAFADAAVAFGRAREISPDWAKAAYYEGWSFEKSGDSNRARTSWDELERAVRRGNEGDGIEPVDPESWFYVGEALKGRGKFAEAASAFRSALALRPVWPEAGYLYGLCLWQGGNPAAARVVWERHCGSLPEDDPLARAIRERLR
jgi:cytochrome c-type biogenesis protein CcmH/NrfG